MGADHCLPLSEWLVTWGMLANLVALALLGWLCASSYRSPRRDELPRARPGTEQTIRRDVWQATGLCAIWALVIGDIALDLLCG